MLRLIGGSRIQRNNSGTTWNGWATRTPTNSTIGLPHWTSTLRNTLQISIGAFLTSPDHWLNYPDLRLIILGLIIFSLRKKITENSLQNYQNYLHAPACYFGAFIPSKSFFFPRRVHLHHFVLRVVLNFDGFVLGPRTRRDRWYDVLDGLHLVDRLAILRSWLHHGDFPQPPSRHPYRNEPLTIFRDNRLLRNIHGEIFFLLLDHRRFFGGLLGGFLGDRRFFGGCLGGSLDDGNDCRPFPGIFGLHLLGRLAFTLRRTLGHRWQGTGVFSSHPGDFARQRQNFFGAAARTHRELHLHILKILRHFCLGGLRRVSEIRWHRKTPFLYVRVHRALALRDELRLCRAFHARPLPRGFVIFRLMDICCRRGHLCENTQHLAEKFPPALDVRTLEILDEIHHREIRVSETLAKDSHIRLVFPQPRLEVVNLGALYGATSPANGVLLRLGANGLRCPPNNFSRRFLARLPRRQRTPNFYRVARATRRPSRRVVFRRHHAGVLVRFTIIAF